MSGAAVKGTVTPLGSLFPADEAQKAARRVQEAISDRRQELDRLHGFITDNSDLTTLVQKLPDDLSHDIMVPFGSAAFFPGRLIHTNEFLVLLGESYYADRTAKQTTEILQRRGKALEAQAESLKATMMDLEAEARFFNSTAAEAAEGLVEIREEYIEEPQINEPDSGISESSSLGSSKGAELKIIDEDAEYARVMARLDELEKEELEAESDSVSDEDEYDEADYGSMSKNNVEETESEALVKDKPTDPVQESKVKDLFNSTASKPSGVGVQKYLTDQSSIMDLNKQFAARDDSCKSDMEQSNTNKPRLPAEPKENLRGFSAPKLEDYSDSAASQTSKVGFGGRKSFTGSIVEHTHGLQPNKSTKTSTSDQPSGSNPSKPVSRFKMQKGKR